MSFGKIILRFLFSLSKFLVKNPHPMPHTTQTTINIGKEPNAGDLYSIHLRTDINIAIDKPHPRPPYNKIHLKFLDIISTYC